MKKIILKQVEDKLSVAGTILAPNPNTADKQFTISFSVPQKQNIKLELFDQVGTSVKTIVSGEFEASEYSAPVATDNLAPGIYFCRLSGDNFSSIKKLLIIR